MYSTTKAHHANFAGIKFLTSFSQKNTPFSCWAKKQCICIAFSVNCGIQACIKKHWVSKVGQSACCDGEKCPTELLSGLVSWSCRWKTLWINTEVNMFTFTYIYIYIWATALFELIWKAAFVWVTPYLVQLTFSLEACSWKNGDLVFQRWSFFSILETCMGIDDPYVKKPRWRRNWNAISKMIKDGLAEGMVTRKLCVGFGPRFDLVSDLVFFRASWIETCQLD